MRSRLGLGLGVITTAMLASSACRQTADLGHNGVGRGGQETTSSGGVGGNSGGSEPTGGVITTSAGASGAPVVAKPPGWSLRDSAPYARVGAVSVIDEDADRLIVFSGSGGNDLWELPLSGARVGQWRQLVASGEAPLVNGGSDNDLGVDSAIYDPFGKRMIVLVQGTGDRDLLSPLWELSLIGPPAWHRFPSTDVAANEAIFGRLSLDREGRRAILMGGWNLPDIDRPLGVWTLNLEGESRWERIAEGAGATNAQQVFDPNRRQLVVFGGIGWRGDVSALSLETLEWTSLRAPGGDFPDHPPVAVFDSDQDRIVMAANEELWLFSLTTNELTRTPLSGNVAAHGSAVADQERGRILYFGGTSLGVFDNAVRALDLKRLSLSTIFPSTRNSLPPGDTLRDGLSQIKNTSALLWDPVRQRVLGINHDDAGSVTLEHGLVPESDWKLRAAGEAPPVLAPNAFYDPDGSAAYTFGGVDGCCATNLLFRLGSAPNAMWEPFDASIGEAPSARVEPTGVYDPTSQRYVLFGGFDQFTTEHELGDTWALSIASNPSWTKLDTAGDAPSPRHGAAAVYDPPGKRMVLYGGYGSDDLFSLALDQEPPTWARLEASGKWPGADQPSGTLSHPVAVYDPSARRMIVVNADIGHDEIYALEMSGALSWHRFCKGSVTPAFYPAATRPILTPDGIYVNSSGGSFFFNLSTPYCD